MCNITAYSASWRRIPRKFRGPVNSMAGNSKKYCNYWSDLVDRYVESGSKPLKTASHVSLCPLRLETYFQNENRFQKGVQLIFISLFTTSYIKRFLTAVV